MRTRKGLILEEKLRATSYWRLGGRKDEDSVRDTGGDRGRIAGDSVKAVVCMVYRGWWQQ